MNLFQEAKEVLDKSCKVNPLGPYGRQKLTGREVATYFRRNKVKDAKLKIFLTASPEIRAKRRYLELQNLGQEVNMPALIADIEKRDIKDSSRELSPLLPAEDAHIIDSSDMTLDEVFSFTENLIREEFI